MESPMNNSEERRAQALETLQREAREFIERPVHSKCWDDHYQHNFADELPRAPYLISRDFSDDGDLSVDGEASDDEDEEEEEEEEEKKDTTLEEILALSPIDPFPPSPGPQEPRDLIDEDEERSMMELRGPENEIS
jgi:hypothetical protein